jgi:hypothetical protein
MYSRKDRGWRGSSELDGEKRRRKREKEVSIIVNIIIERVHIIYHQKEGS